MTQATHPQSAGEIIAQLMAEAQSISAFSKRMQAERTAEYVSRGDLDACYKGIEPSETIHWQAADRIADLTLTAARLTERVKVLEAALKKIADQMTLGELSENDEDCEGDFEGAYDALIELARAALTNQAQTHTDREG